MLTLCWEMVEELFSNLLPRINNSSMDDLFIYSDWAKVEALALHGDKIYGKRFCKSILQFQSMGTSTESSLDEGLLFVYQVRKACRGSASHQAPDSGQHR